IASGGWILPALVGVHVHLGIAEIGGPLDFEVLHDDVRQLARSGVGAARILGSPERLPAHMLSSPGKPLLLTAGVPVAAIDRFIPGWGRRVPDRLLAQACADEARCGWSKIGRASPTEAMAPRSRPTPSKRRSPQCTASALVLQCTPRAAWPEPGRQRPESIRSSTA